MWEKLPNDTAADFTILSQRMRVPGGWIVRTIADPISNSGVSVHQVFISDPNHRWELQKVDEEEV